MKLFVSIPYERESLSKVVRVSIPYERESLSKEAHGKQKHLGSQRRFNSLRTGKPIQSGRQNARKSFNSLRTGKPIQSYIWDYAFNQRLLTKKFQFPTDGKAYPKQVKSQDFVFQFPTDGKAYPKLAINSLRTGKPIQSGN